jgi:hypothetical protein
MDFIEGDSEILGRKIIIEYLRNQFNTQRGDFCEGELVYINLAKSYFNNAVRGLGSIINDELCFQVNQDAKWFYEAITGKEIISEQEANKTIKKIKTYQKMLNQFIENPENSNITGNTNKLSMFIDNLWNMYPEKLYEFEQ